MKYISQHDVVTHNLKQNKMRCTLTFCNLLYFIFKKRWSWATKVISVTTCSVRNTGPRKQRMLCFALGSPSVSALMASFWSSCWPHLPHFHSTSLPGGVSGGPMVRICLAMQRTQVPPWFWKIPHAAGWLSPRVTSLAALWSPYPHLLKLACPRACALQRERTLQWEAHALQLESSLCSL